MAVRQLYLTLLALTSLLLAACSSVPAQPVGTAAAMQAGEGGMIVVVVDNPAEAGVAPPGSTPQGYDGSVSYSVSSSSRNAIATLAQKYDLRQVRAWPISQLKVYCVVFALGQPAQRNSLLLVLAQDPLVKSVQPLQSFNTLGSDPDKVGAKDGAYNDPYFSLQKGFAAIDAGGAQRWTRGEGVRVAVIDTGMDTSHPDLRGRISAQRNFVDGDSGQFQRDRHGTEVAGIIAANANNHEGIVGIAPGVTIIALKACWQPEAGSAAAACNSFTLAEALGVALDTGVDVINLSLGGPADPLLAQLVNYALARGVVVVGAVPPSGRLDGFPVGIAGVIAVDNRSHADSDHVLPAPGHDVLTLMPGGHYDFASGSSLATAHVSGAIALLLALKPHMGSAALATTLRNSIRQNGDGLALINVCQAVASLHAGTPCNSVSDTVAQRSTVAPNLP